MDAENINKNSDEKKNQIEKRVELPMHEFFIINFFTYLIPLYVCLGIILIFEYFLISIVTIDLIWHITLLPVFLLFIYYIYIIIFIEFAAFWIRRWNKKSLPQQGIFKRILYDKKSEEGVLIRYYHRRGFILRLCIWISSKSPFPWLLNRALRRVGHNKIGKNVIYCNSYVGLEFTEIEDNVFIYPTSFISSHSVTSIFGKLNLIEIKIGKNTIVYPGVNIGPGTQIEKNCVIYPNALLHKNWRGKKDKCYYKGSPAVPFDIEGM